MAAAITLVSAAATTLSISKTLAFSRSHPKTLFTPYTYPSRPLQSSSHKHQLSSNSRVCTSIAPVYSSSLDVELPNANQVHIKRLLLCILVWIALSLVWPFACGASSLAAATAADDSIRASGIGLKVATALRRSGWADEAIVLALATLPVIELRGAIPVGYWMKLHPLHLTILSILGNMVPVPIIVIYLKKLASFASQKNSSMTRFLDRLIGNAREKAGPVEEFRWLGLMLFVAVPFPGTGAWTGAIIAAILDMPFWSAISANFFGVVLAGLLVNLLVNLGLKYAVVTGLLLFFVSTVMWSVLRHLKKSLSSKLW